MYFPDRGCVHTLLTLYVYATGGCSVLACLANVTASHREPQSDIDRFIVKRGFQPTQRTQRNERKERNEMTSSLDRPITAASDDGLRRCRHTP